jgi:hypothetical protein
MQALLSSNKEPISDWKYVYGSGIPLGVYYSDAEADVCGGHGIPPERANAEIESNL